MNTTVIVLRYSGLYGTYTGSNGIMYYRSEADTLVSSKLARYARGHDPSTISKG